MKLTWRDQYDRMHRSYEAIPEPADPDSEAAFFDASYHFFMDVSHVRDWLGNDPSTNLGGVKAVSRGIFHQPRYGHIQLCVGPASRAKHLRVWLKWEPLYAEAVGLTRQGSLTMNAVVVAANKEEGISQDEGDDSETNNIQGSRPRLSALLIRDPKTGTEYDSREVAHKALKEWDQYLKDKGLL